VELERASRLGKLKISLDQIRSEWKKSGGGEHLKMIAEHYGVFEDLFVHGYFTPHVMVDFTYDYKEQYCTPVYSGNRIKPSDAEKAPTVNYESEENSWWSIVMTNPDCHFQDSSAEYLHWFVGNIPGNQVANGEVLMDYLQPFPAKGTGYQRFIFVLYKQECKIDWSKYKKPLPCRSLQERTFKTFEFYKDHEDVITPAGLAFFQADWDDTLTPVFHNTLNMKEPVFEYDFPEPYIEPQERYGPRVRPFDMYLDQYRDPKDISKQVFEKRLKNISPYKPEPPPFPYPHALGWPKGVDSSWEREQLRRERLKIGKYKDV